MNIEMLILIAACISLFRSPEIKRLRRQVDTVSHPELLSLKAGQSIQSLGVFVFMVQGLKYTRRFPLLLFIGPHAAATVPETKVAHTPNKFLKSEPHTWKTNEWLRGDRLYLNLQSSGG